MKTVLILLIVLTSCITSISNSDLYTYKKNPEVSNNLGEPVNDSTYYFPIEYFIDSIKYSNDTEISLDTLSVKWFSETLHFMNEPILYNYYLNKEIYRLTWLRSFHPDIVLRLENLNGRITMIQKELTLIKPWKQIDSITYKYEPDKFKLKNRSKKLKPEFWIDFEQLLNNHFYQMPTTVAWEMGTDGSEWILESHNENGYYVVNRWTPNENQYAKFREIGNYLIDASIFKNDERY